MKSKINMDTKRLNLATTVMALALGLFALLAIPPTATAAIIDWSSVATNNSWTAAGNWIGGVVPADSLVTDIARFNQTSYAFQPTLTIPRKINGLIIGDGTTATASLTNLTGTQLSRLAVGSGGIVMNANSGPVLIGSQTLNQGINLGANQSWANNSSSLLTVHQIGNTNNADTTTPYTVTINGSGSGGIMIDGLIENGGAVPQSSTGSVVTLIINSSGSHVTTISNLNNPFTGGVTLVAGSLSVGRDNALGGPSNTVTIQGGTLDVAGNVGRAATSSFKLDGDFIFTSSGGTGGQYNMNGTNTLGGNRTITVNSGSLNITALGDDGNGYSLTKTGTALMRLKGAGTYSGDTKVTGGGLSLFDNNLAMQNSAFDTDGITNGLTLGVAVKSPTFGGLKGTNNLFEAMSTNAYPTMASLTLNPGAGKTLSYSGIIASTTNTSGLSLVKTGAGTQILSGTNSYAGTTTVSNGTLLINGDSSAVTNTWTVAAAATLGGSGTIGGNVTYDSGAFALFTNGSTLTIIGALNANANVVHLNLSNNVPADTYLLATYNASGSSGSFDSTPVIVNGGSFAANTTNYITTAGGQVNLVVQNLTPSNPPATNITYSVSNGQLVLNWPNGLGWNLQAQTNNLSTGLTTNWSTISNATSPYTNTINPANPTVFYRLKF